MFYSHEVLTSRKHGVATVWLVATLGAKSSLKSLSRKSILDVDVAKACDTILSPGAPLALRLQSNLLYGVVRVYSQQCRYVLLDTETARNSMRLLLKVLRSGELDVASGIKGKKDQLLLQDDPEFLPDIDLLPSLSEFPSTSQSANEDSLRSFLSPHEPRKTDPQGGPASEISYEALILPNSTSSQGRGYFEADIGLARCSEAKEVDLSYGELLEDDLGIVVQDDGNIILREETPLALRATVPPHLPSERAHGQNTLRSDRSGIQKFAKDDDFNPLSGDDEIELVGSTSAVGQGVHVRSHTNSDTVEVPMRRRKAAPKSVPIDSAIELRNSDLSEWNTNYLSHMKSTIHQSNASRSNSLAKQNARAWFLDEMGKGDRGPLSLFSGLQLLEALTGVKLRGEKRKYDNESDTDEPRRSKSRSQNSTDREVARARPADGFLPVAMDEDVEQGREAPTPLDDRHLSSIMPWNRSEGSLHQFNASGYPASATLGRTGSYHGTIGGRRGSRLTSASPLMGRGLSSGNSDLLHMLPGSQDDVGALDLDAMEDFELFGPAAQVDTQMAAQSQWQRAALDGESSHFLEFVRAGIRDQLQHHEADEDHDKQPPAGTVAFSQLLPPDRHSCVVAAQALLHVLFLATKGLLTINQPLAFGSVSIGVNDPHSSFP